MSTLTSKEEKLKKIKHLVAAHKREAKKKGVDSSIDFGSNLTNREVLSFGVESLNSLVGGGVPRGQFTVFAGPEKCGKSTLCASLVAKTQADGGVVCWVDAENQLDLEWLRKMGVATDELLIINDLYFEPTMDSLLKYIKEEVLDLAVVDSVTALASLMEVEDKKGLRKLADNSIALQPRKLSQFFRMSTGIVNKSKAAVVLIGQVRCDIMSFGNLETIPGGKALEHYASLRIKIRRGKKAEAPGRGVDGFSCVMKLDKTRNSNSLSEGQEIKIPFYFESGFGEGVVLSDTEKVEVEF